MALPHVSQDRKTQKPASYWDKVEKADKSYSKIDLVFDLLGIVWIIVRIFGAAAIACAIAGYAGQVMVVFFGVSAYTDLPKELYGLWLFGAIFFAEAIAWFFFHRDYFPSKR